MNKSSFIILFATLLLGVFLYTYRIGVTMDFFGDIGWFYLDARDILTGERFPLVGITSSHPWIHQGAYWTYLLVIALYMGQGNPLSGGYLAAGIGVATIFSLYFIGRHLFGEKVGLLSAFLFTVSPLAISQMRLPYHTTPLPLLSLWYLYFLSQWVKGSSKAFIFLCITLALLYNFELASVMFVPPFVLVFLYGWIKQTNYFFLLCSLRVVLQSVLSVFFVMLPMLLYDIQHGFPQTIRFAGWFVYRFFVTIGFHKLDSTTPVESWQSFLTFSFLQLQRIFFLPHSAVGLLLGSLVLIGCLYLWKRVNSSFGLFLLCLFSFLGMFIGYKTPSDAYVTLFFSYILLGASIVTVYLGKRFFWIFVLGWIVIGIVNVYTLIGQDFSLSREKNYAFTYKERLQAMDEIVQMSGDSSYTIRGEKMLIPSPSFIMNYEYLLWYLGHPVVEEFPEKIFTIQETKNTIIIND